MRSIGEVVRMTDSPLNLGREGMLGRIAEVLPNYLRNQPILPCDDACSAIGNAATICVFAGPSGLTLRFPLGEQDIRLLANSTYF
jgi:hypothetical protein